MDKEIIKAVIKVALAIAAGAASQELMRQANKNINNHRKLR